MTLSYTSFQSKRGCWNVKVGWIIYSPPLDHHFPKENITMAKEEKKKLKKKKVDQNEKKPKSQEKEVKFLRAQVWEIAPNDWNPNDMTPEEEELLRDNLQRVGFVAPLMVTEWSDPNDPSVKYRVVDGEHRLQAAKDLGYETVRVALVDITEAEAKKQTVRMNKIKGVLDFDKMNKLVSELIASGEMDLDEAAFELGFADEDEFELIREAMRESLPDEDSKKEFDKRSKNAKSVDDIYSLVMVLMKKYGNTLPANFMIVAVGRGRNLWVKLDGRHLRRFESAARDCLESGYSFDSYLTSVLDSISDVEKYIDEHKDELVEIDDDVENVEDFYEDINEDLEQISEEVKKKEAV